MLKKIKILCVVGTRPEGIKMAPVINQLKLDHRFQVCVVSTAQHRYLLDQVLNIFGIVPNIDLDVMRTNQNLSRLTSNLLSKLSGVIESEIPDAVLAQGDTTTVLATAINCFYHKIPFGHVEAGLRTWDINSPFPEEMNRVFITKIAKWHFAPTNSTYNNLLKDGVQKDSIFVTGNTVIDALYACSKKEVELPFKFNPECKIILVTIHRRENFGLPLREICNAILTILDRNDDLQIIFPVHPNPNIRENIYNYLGGHPRVTLIAPLDYLTFVCLMKKCTLILSDSGGIQEEAPALNKPVLVLRESTERPECVQLGVVKLVGTRFESIVNEVQQLLENREAYLQMQKGISPYGDGFAAKRILQVLQNYFFKS